MWNLILFIVISSLLILFGFLCFRYKYKLKHLTGELEQERQQNTDLERNLVQANQKAGDLLNELKEIKANSRQIVEPREEHLSRENERLSKELAASNSSLEQSDQRNKQLTGELAQANQRNKRFSINLRQEREDKANLERKLVNLNSPAYQTIIEAIYSENNAKTDEQKRECLEKLKEISISLGEEYQRSEISPDYSRLDYQEAYLLRYFLPYSQPVPYLLNYLKLKKNSLYQLPENGALTASFFGCGPGPELYGLMSYLNNPQSGISVSAVMLDIAPWKHGRKIVFNHLLTRVKTHVFESDLVGTTSDFLSGDSEKWVSSSDLIVIQHCLNERHNARSNQLTENMKQLVAKMKTGAVMLIIERARYQIVKELLDRFCYELQERFGDSLKVERYTEKHGIEIKPILDVIPKALATYFFTEESGHSLKSVKFIWVAVVKK